MTGGAGALQPEGSRRHWEEALEAVRWDWDTAYIIGHDEHGWHAGRRDKIGHLITAADPAEPRREIAEDYELKPVPREPMRRRLADRACVLGADAGELLTDSTEP